VADKLVFSVSQLQRRVSTQQHIQGVAGGKKKRAHRL
jgi:hypothetical protein